MAAVEQAVADCSGDIEAAVESLLDASPSPNRQHEGSPEQQQQQQQRRPANGSANGAWHGSAERRSDPEPGRNGQLPRKAQPAAAAAAASQRPQPSGTQAQHSGPWADRAPRQHLQHWSGPQGGDRAAQWLAQDRDASLMQQHPASTGDPSSTWAVLRAKQAEETPSPPASGLPSQADLWSSLGIHLQPQPLPPAAEPLLGLSHARGTQQQQQAPSEGSTAAPLGSRLFSYTSTAGDSTPKASSSSNLASRDASLDGSGADAATLVRLPFACPCPARVQTPRASACLSTHVDCGFIRSW